MDEKKEKWYLKTSVLVIALLSVGPFALPLLWFNPRFSLMMKTIISVAVIVLSYYLIAITADYLKTLINDYLSIDYQKLLM